MTPTYHNLAENLNVSLLFQLSFVKFELEIQYSRVLGVVIWQADYKPALVN